MADKDNIKNEKQKKIQSDYKEKGKKLTDAYESLVSAINLYPIESPNDIMEIIELAPNFRLLNYKSVLKTLDIKTEFYKKEMESYCLDYERKSDIEDEIYNIKLIKGKIEENKNNYFRAKKAYSSFEILYKNIFCIYASQDVRNRLVEFKVNISNTFIAGLSVNNFDDSTKNIIEVSKRELIDAIRDDLGNN
ncbi:hypothetical protein BTM29_09455 [Companilactobacillus allii]|uniref:Uncharacterized protein n=1 Tax=Companilactobacillus allii TaxID=1847728 RepID=A0A1P8Q6C0_9LACO|nr:hypothetical protein BTM29_09455 [Companilactobacillus allii]